VGHGSGVSLPNTDLLLKALVEIILLLIPLLIGKVREIITLSQFVGKMQVI
jgi:hypothetical protein